MHMMLVILGGIALFGVFCLFGWLWGEDSASVAVAAKAFIPLWLAMALVNLWVGVTKAGYGDAGTAHLHDCRHNTGCNSCDRCMANRKGGLTRGGT